MSALDRMREKTSREQARTVACEACGSVAGASCTRPTDDGRVDVPWVHLARRAAYREREATIDNVMRTLFDVRAGALEPVSDERWAQHKERFRSTAAILRADAIKMMEEDD